MRHHDFGDGRHVLRLDPGEDVLESIRHLAEKEKITAGTVTGLGSVDVVTLAFLDAGKNAYLNRRFEERMEVASLSGSLSMDGERAHLHLHAVVSPREFLAYAGHVVEAKVGAVLEVFVTALPGRLERVAVEGQPFPALLLPGERALRPSKKEGGGGR